MVTGRPTFARIGVLRADSDLGRWRIVERVSLEGIYRVQSSLVREFVEK